MIHTNRIYSIADVPDAATLATRLTECSWTLCTGFRFGAYLWLNDSIIEDSVQEYAVIRESDGMQVESITVGWCEAAEIVEYANEIVAGEHAELGVQLINVTTSGDHHCQLCA